LTITYENLFRIAPIADQEKIPVGGMHLPLPSVGTVKKEKKGYTFELKKQ